MNWGIHQDNRTHTSMICFYLPNRLWFVIPRELTVFVIGDDTDFTAGILFDDRIMHVSLLNMVVLIRNDQSSGRTSKRL